MNKHDEFWRNNATAEDYADTNISTDKQVKYLEDAIRPTGVSNGGQIVEFGCGYGRLTREIKKLFPNAFVTGLDINPEILKQAETYSGWRGDRENTTKYPFYYCMDSLRLPKPVDAIYCVQVLQHMPNDRKREFIADAYKSLRHSGVLAFQYVEGSSDTFLTHDARWSDVSQWLCDAGFEIASVEHNLIQDRWTWVTAVKE